MRAADCIVHVADLGRALQFYAAGLGLHLLEHLPGEDIALVTSDGYAILLAGPRAVAPFTRLRPAGEVLPTEGTLFLAGGDIASLEERRAELHQRNIAAELRNHDWGETTLRVTDPDGYLVLFWTPTALPQEAVLARYTAGPDELEAILAGLTAPELDRRQAGSWSIREYVHHIVDAEALTYQRLLHTLAAPDVPYAANRHAPQQMTDALRSFARPLEPALQRFRGLRADIAWLVNAHPGAWGAGSDSGSSVGALIGMLMSHACAHFDDIRAMRSSGSCHNER